VRDIGLDRREGRGVVLRAGEREQLRSVTELAVQIGEDADEIVELLFLATQLLGPLGVGPDVRLFQLAAYFGETRLLPVEVKDTSAAPPISCRVRRAWRRAG